MNMTDKELAKEAAALLPCPFCGEDELVTIDKLSGGESVANCQACGAGTGTCCDDEQARKEWNTRPLTKAKEQNEDTKRLDWLQANPNTLANCTWINAHVGRCFDFSRGGKTVGDCATTLRAAIDSAMNKQKRMFKEPPSAEWLEKHADDDGPEIIGPLEQAGGQMKSAPWKWITCLFLRHPWIKKKGTVRSELKGSKGVVLDY
jgi:hypothetical protein